MTTPPRADDSAAADAAGARNAFLAGFLGWTLDAFDFFVLVFVLPAVADEFGRPVKDVAFTLTLTLAMRPLGAVLFGWMADRYGRRVPLMIDVVFYSVVEVLSGLAPDYRTFLVLRALYGIGMGGEWGVGASLAMETVSRGRRGVLSGLLQEGYALGYLLAAMAYFLIFPRFGWRMLFIVGGLPALLTLYIRARVPESPSWRKRRPEPARIWAAVRENLPRLGYLVLVMTLMGFLSHGTQDLYPTFLKEERALSARTVATIAIVYNVGAILGGLSFGALSDRFGRRRAMAGATALAVVMIPAWVWSPTAATIAAGAFAMQFMVQGAWGVVPAHLTELSPDEVRGLFPGLAYQLGILLSAVGPWLEALLAVHMGYGNALALVSAIVMVSAAAVIALGTERHAADFSA